MTAGVVCRPRIRATGLTLPNAVDPTLLPFAATSVWRLGIATGVTFASAGDARNVAMHNTGADGSGQVWLNSDSYSHPVTFASTADPLATVTDTVHAAGDIPSGGTWTEYIPAAALIEPSGDHHMHVVTPDRTSIREHFGAARQSSTAYTVSRQALVSLAGSGIGPQNGTRAYGGAAIGGLIRSWEIDTTHPKYTGVIAHPLAVALRNNQLYFDSAGWVDGYGYYGGGALDVSHRPGWPSGTPATGFMKMPGYTWPASEQDYDSPNNYTGAIPMGSYFAIPPSVDITTLGLQTPQGLMLAKAAQDYGVYVTDRSGSSVFYVEYDSGGVASAWANSLRGGYSAHDPRVVFNALRVVTGNSPATPNGGALGAARRA